MGGRDRGKGQRKRFCDVFNGMGDVSRLEEGVGMGTGSVEIGLLKVMK